MRSFYQLSESQQQQQALRLVAGKMASVGCLIDEALALAKRAWFPEERSLLLDVGLGVDVERNPNAVTTLIRRHLRVVLRFGSESLPPLLECIVGQFDGMVDFHALISEQNEKTRFQIAGWSSIMTASSFPTWRLRPCG
jgi:hypothetical protein